MATARIASIHFYPVSLDRSIYGGMYEMPAVALGASPFILTIQDSVQRDEGPYASGPGGNRRQKTQALVAANEIARDCIIHWTQNGFGMTPDCHPGIWHVRDRVAVVEELPDGTLKAELDVLGNQIYRPATAEEAKAMWAEDLAAAKAADLAYAEFCFAEGNAKAAKKEMIPFIPKIYKAGVKHYGMPTEWALEGGSVTMIKCAVCTKPISAQAIICPECGQPPDIAEWAAFTAQKEAALAAAKKEIRTQ